MQPGRARTSGLGVPLLPLARWVGWVAPVRPTHGVLVLSCPSAALRVCSVLGRWAPVHRYARAVCCGASAVSCASWLLFTDVLARCVVLHVRCPGPLGSCSPVCVLCAVRVCHGWLCPSSSPRNFRFFFNPFFFFYLFIFFYFLFWEKKQKQQREKQGRAYTAGTGMGSWCGGAIALCPLACVVGAVAAVAPQGCGSRVLMYTGLGQCGFGEVSLCFWSLLVRRLCGLWVWAVVTLFPQRAWLGVKGQQFRAVARV